MSGQSLFEKVWDDHVVVPETPDQPAVFYIDLHLIHEVTTPQSFTLLREQGLKVRRPDLTLATLDHSTPTVPIAKLADLDVVSEPPQVAQIKAMIQNCQDFGIVLHGFGSDQRGIVHVIGPELGATQPGKTIVCGDSHTSTHGAFGNISLGIGTSQVAHVLATQTLAMERPKVKRIVINGALQPGVFAKDVILYIIRKLGVQGGVGYAYEYAGDVFDRMNMEERMTVCNMSIEGGARCGYVNPDTVSIEYLRGRQYSPEGAAFDRAAKLWLSLASDPGADYADRVEIDGSSLAPAVSWGINPGQSVAVDERLPRRADAPRAGQAQLAEAFEFMGLTPGDPLEGTPIDVAFIGSCTNGRLSDLREAARVARTGKVAGNIRALVVPGSQQVAREAEAEGLDEVFRAAGFQWREPGCSMCLAMNPDKLRGREVCASSSNRNFKGRQGSPSGRTLLMSPAMVAAAAIAGEVVDVRKIR